MTNAISRQQQLFSLKFLGYPILYTFQSLYQSLRLISACFSKLWDSAARGVRTRVIDDQYGCCTYVADLVGAVLQGLGRLEGTYHIANRGRVSRFAVAQRVFEALGVPNLVGPCRSAEFASLARRPASSMLDVTKIETALGIRLRDWQLALGEYLETCAQGV